MKKIAVLGLLVISLMIFRKEAKAGYCSYGSTQARAQKDIHDPWKPSINLDDGDWFNIGSFHNGTGQFAYDTIIKVREPDGDERSGYYNGQRIKAREIGTYTITVETKRMDGEGCREQAWVYVTDDDKYKDDYPKYDKRVDRSWEIISYVGRQRPRLSWQQWDRLISDFRIWWDGKMREVGY